MHYILIRKRRNKKMYLRIKDGQLVVTAPTLMPKSQIDRFIESNRPWIEKQLKSIDTNTLKNGDVIHLVNGDFTLIIDPTLTRISLKNGEIKVRNQKDFEKILKMVAKSVLTPLFEDIRKQLGFNNMKLQIGVYSSQWGSCNKMKRDIHLNAYLIMTELSFIQSVIVHEFAHMYVSNHSKQFYDVVYRWMPNYDAIHRKYKHYRFPKIESVSYD